MSEPQFHATDSFDIGQMATFMRMPAVYAQASDALAPPGEAMQFEEFMAEPFVWTLAACYGEHIIGYVYLVQRTSIGGEIHVGFHPQFRGRVAKRFVDYALGRAFTDKGFLKLWAIIPSDNKPALMLAASCQFVREGVLTRAIARMPVIVGRRFPDRWQTAPGLRDLVLLGRSKE